MNKVQGKIDNLSTDLANTQNTLSDAERELETAKKDQIAAQGMDKSAQGLYLTGSVKGLGTDGNKSS